VNAIVRVHQSGSWGRRRWLTTVGVVLAGQLLLVFLLSSPPARKAGARPQRSLYRMMTSPATQQQVSQAPWLEDPAVFALISPRGFSGPVWRELPRFEQPSAEWSEPPRWLGLDVARLGEPLQPGPEGRRPAVQRMVEKPPVTAPVAALLPEQSITNSTLRLEGDVADRQLLTAPELPGWPHEDVLLPSVVQVLVNEDGAVVSATLLAASGLPAADERALQLARAARFAAASGGRHPPALTWGRMIFHWRALEASVAAPSPKPASS